MKSHWYFPRSYTVYSSFLLWKLQRKLSAVLSGSFIIGWLCLEVNRAPCSRQPMRLLNQMILWVLSVEVEIMRLLELLRRRHRVDLWLLKWQGCPLTLKNIGGRMMILALTEWLLLFSWKQRCLGISLVWNALIWLSHEESSVLNMRLVNEQVLLLLL